MSWTLDNWKADLPHRALQKVEDLEVQLEKLKKERQQRQFQLETSDTALLKQKQKYDESCNEASTLKKEVKKLLEDTTSLDRAKGRLSHDLQVKDAQVCSLEGQLGSARKQIDSLQQELKRVQAELEKLQNAEHSGESLLFSTPSWNYASFSTPKRDQTEYRGDGKERGFFEKQPANQEVNAKCPLQLSVVEKSPQHGGKVSTRTNSWHQDSTPVSHTNCSSERATRRGRTTPSSPSCLFPWEQDDGPQKTSSQSGYKPPAHLQTKSTEDRVNSSEHMGIEEQELRKRNEALQNTVHNLEVWIQTLEKEAQAHSQEVQNTQSSLKILKEKLASSEQSLGKSQDELAVKTTNCEEALTKCQSQEQKLKQLAEELNCQRQNAEIARRAAEQRRKDQEKEHHKELAEQQRLTQNLENQHKSETDKLNQELQQARNQHHVLQAQIDKILLQKQCAEKDLEAAQSKLQWTEKELQSSQKAEADLQIKLTDLLQHKEQLTVNLEQSLRKVQQMEEHIKTVNQELLERKNSSEDLQAKYLGYTSPVSIRASPTGESYSPRIVLKEKHQTQNKRKDTLKKEEVKIISMSCGNIEEHSISSFNKREPGEGMDSEISEQQRMTLGFQEFHESKTEQSEESYPVSQDDENGNSSFTSDDLTVKTPDTLEREIKRLKSDLKESQIELDQRLEELNIQRKAARDYHAKLKQTAKKHSIEIDKLQKAKDTFKERVDCLEKELEVKRAEVVNLKGVHASLEAQLNLPRDSRDLEKEIMQSDDALDHKDTSEAFQKQKCALLYLKEQDTVNENTEFKDLKQSEKIKQVEQCCAVNKEASLIVSVNNNNCNNNISSSHLVESELNESFSTDDNNTTIIKELQEILSSKEALMKARDKELEDLKSKLHEMETLIHNVDKFALLKTIKESKDVQTSPTDGMTNLLQLDLDMEQLHRKCRELVWEKDQAEKKTLEAQSKFDNLQSKINRETSQLTLAFETQSQNIENLLANLEEKDNAVEQLSQELQVAKQKVSILQDENNVLSAKLCLHVSLDKKIEGIPQHLESRNKFEKVSKGKSEIEEPLTNKQQTPLEKMEAIFCERDTWFTTASISCSDEEEKIPFSITGNATVRDKVSRKQIITEDYPNRMVSGVVETDFVNGKTLGTTEVLTTVLEKQQRELSQSQDSNKQKKNTFPPLNNFQMVINNEENYTSLLSVSSESCEKTIGCKIDEISEQRYTCIPVTEDLDLPNIVSYPQENRDSGSQQVVQTVDSYSQFPSEYKSLKLALEQSNKALQEQSDKVQGMIKEIEDAQTWKYMFIKEMAHILKSCREGGDQQKGITRNLQRMVQEFINKNLDDELSELQGTLEDYTTPVQQTKEKVTSIVLNQVKELHELVSNLTEEKNKLKDELELWKGQILGNPDSSSCSDMLVQPAKDTIVLVHEALVSLPCTMGKAVSLRTGAKVAETVSYLEKPKDSPPSHQVQNTPKDTIIHCKEDKNDRKKCNITSDKNECVSSGIEISDGKLLLVMDSKTTMDSQTKFRDDIAGSHSPLHMDQLLHCHNQKNNEASLVNHTKTMQNCDNLKVGQSNLYIPLEGETNVSKHLTDISKHNATECVTRTNIYTEEIRKLRDLDLIIDNQMNPITTLRTDSNFTLDEQSKDVHNVMTTFHIPEKARETGSVSNKLYVSGSDKMIEFRGATDQISNINNVLGCQLKAIKGDCQETEPLIAEQTLFEIQRLDKEKTIECLTNPDFDSKPEVVDKVTMGERCKINKEDVYDFSCSSSEHMNKREDTTTHCIKPESEHKQLKFASPESQLEYVTVNVTDVAEEHWKNAKVINTTTEKNTQNTDYSDSALKVMEQQSTINDGSVLSPEEVKSLVLHEEELRMMENGTGNDYALLTWPESLKKHLGATPSEAETSLHLCSDLTLERSDYTVSSTSSESKPLNEKSWMDGEMITKELCGTELLPSSSQTEIHTKVQRKIENVCPLHRDVQSVWTQTEHDMVSIFSQKLKDRTMSAVAELQSKQTQTENNCNWQKAWKDSQTQTELIFGPEENKLEIETEIEDIEDSSSLGDDKLLSLAFPLESNPAEIAERILRNRNRLSVAYDDTEYEPYGLPEVVMKGFADIPSGPSCPYVLRRGLLGTTLLPVKQKPASEDSPNL
uniref:Centromere protein F-like n=1 Tax=Erpetoichthys calabaricus TaxID=27687 RepID=A0A8C4RYG4_ERPCA